MYVTERFNAWSHLVGAVLAVAGAVFLILKAADAPGALPVVSVSIYSATLIALYLGSTLYHSVRPSGAKRALQKFDHCAIYLLIAGSYTPFALLTLGGAWGWSLFGVSWGLAAFGIVQELTLGRRTRTLSLILYVLMGWLVLVAMVPLVHALSTPALVWLVAGGVLYSAGVYWFVNDERIRHGHGIWHLFVLGGSICQFVCVYLYASA